jgi:hypothetical protein
MNIKLLKIQIKILIHIRYFYKQLIINILTHFRLNPILCGTLLKEGHWPPNHV